jgi:hypothetical protein
MNFATLVERVRAILTEPATEWPVIADEPATPAGLYKNYVAILAAIPAVSGFVKGSLLGIDVPMIGTMRIGIGAGIAAMVVGYALSLAQVYVIAIVVDALAPTFGARKDPLQALKLSAYALTAAWVAGLAQILPWIGVLIVIGGGLYSIYLFYLGLPVMTKCPQQQAGSFALVSIVAAVVLNIVSGSVVGSIAGGAPPGHIGRSDIDYTKGSPIGTLDDRSHKIENALKQAEQAQKSAPSQTPSADADD